MALALKGVDVALSPVAPPVSWPPVSWLLIGTDVFLGLSIGWLVGGLRVRVHHSNAKPVASAILSLHSEGWSQKGPFSPGAPSVGPLG